MPGAKHAAWRAHMLSYIQVRTSRACTLRFVQADHRSCFVPSTIGPWEGVEPRSPRASTGTSDEDRANRCACEGALRRECWMA